MIDRAIGADAIPDLDATARSKRSAAWGWTMTSGVLTLGLASLAVLLPLIEKIPGQALVGWLLLAGGLLEAAVGTRRQDAAGGAAVASGMLALLAGALFLASRYIGIYSVSWVVMAWLMVRGCMILAAAHSIKHASVIRAWLGFSGGADLALGIAMVVGLPVAGFIIVLFGPTLEVLAGLALILSVSFLVSGVSQIAIALDEKRRTPPDRLG